MNKDQKLLQEAYESIYESAQHEPLYFGPEEQKQKWKEWLIIHSFKWKVNQEGLIDVEGFVGLNGERRLNDPFEELFPLKTLPFHFKTVSESFDCCHNELANLKGCPEIVEGSFLCFHNPLESLEGAPKVIKGNFSCYNNKLTSLKGCPEIVEGTFDCSYSRITSLMHCPKYVGLNFECSHSKLVTLEGCPKVIKGNFNCSNNESLESLVGGPEIVKGNFYCGNTNLTSLKGAPKEIKGSFISYQFSDEDYRKYARKIKSLESQLSKDFDTSVLDDF